MTHTEANAKLLGKATKCTNKHDTLTLAINILSEAYYDLETSKCCNCKYNLNGIECNCNESAVEWIDTETFPDFGCTKFERKEGN